MWSTVACSLGRRAEAGGETVRVLAAIRSSAENVEQDIRKREQDEDTEIEKKLRAEGVDPVQIVLERLSTLIHDASRDSIKSKIIAPILYDCLDSDSHRAKRQKLGHSDGPKVLEMLNGTPSRSFTPRHPLSHLARNTALRLQDSNTRRLNSRLSTDAFEDSRRRKKPPPRAGLMRLQDQVQPQDDSDSEDEDKTPLTIKDHDDESRPLSSVSRTSTPFEDHTLDAPMTKDFKASSPASTHVEPAADMREGSKPTPALDAHRFGDEPKFSPLIKELLGDCANKRPEQMADEELVRTMSALDWQGPWRGFRERCQRELADRKRALRDDAVFETARLTTPVVDAHAVREATKTESKLVTTARKRATPKKKTKKDVSAERAALKKAQRADRDAPMRDAPTDIEVDEPQEEDYAQSEDVIRSTEEWAQSSTVSKRTFEDDNGVSLDLDGWQYTIRDDEDLRFLVRTLAKTQPAAIADARYWAWKQKRIKSLNTLPNKLDAPRTRVEIQGYYVPNTSGCARTEGIKKILNSEKSKYLPHRIKVQKAREEREALAANKDPPPAETAKQASETFKTSSSRSNRVNNRRLVNDINLQKQNAPALGADTDAFRFNQLKKRKKHVRFDRSAIHGWGLYTEENITAGDLIIEYVGEKLRQKVADLREIQYDRQGIGSSYLFRMAEDEIIDATKKGGIARFINHSCMPNCTAKIIKVEGTRRIVIYALKDISRGEELTYDYKFERELFSNDRIPCLCGTVGCKGFLN